MFQHRQTTNLGLQRKLKESISEQDTGKLVFVQAPLSLPPSTSLYALLGRQVILIRWFQGILVPVLSMDGMTMDLDGYPIHQIHLTIHFHPPNISWIST